MAAWLEAREQAVPPYSAAKYRGQPFYRLARRGVDVPARTKSIKISHAEVQWVSLPDVRFRVTCSSGSYIRSLAHSLGMRLGCGATLTELTREYSHPFGLDAAHCLDDVLAEPERLPHRVLPLTSALPQWPVFRIGPEQAGGLGNGAPVAHRADFGPFREGGCAVFTDARGRPLALADARCRNGRRVWVVLRGLFTPQLPDASGNGG